jgi:23S rRNA (adenine2503-C2)-methyltransferase
VVTEHVSADGTVKWLFDVGDGNAVESVFIPEDDRGTLCVVPGRLRRGLPLLLDGASGLQPQPQYRRNPCPALVCRAFAAQAFGTEDRIISNVVMMGMGEPLQNYSALVPALRVMLDDHGYGLSRRRVTVSTSGGAHDGSTVAGLRGGAGGVHAPNDPLRDNLVPLNKKYPIAELLDACERYLEFAPRDFITFEYCMLDGVNDQPEHARQLIELVRARRWQELVQVQSDPVQSLPASGLLRSPSARVTEFASVAEQCRHRDHGAQDPR